MNSDVGGGHIIHADRMFCRGGGGVTGVIRCRDTRMHLLAVGQIRGVHRDAVAQLAIRHRLHRTGKFMAVDRQRHHIMHARIAAHGAGHSGGQLLAFRRIDDVVTGNLVNGDIGGRRVIHAHRMVCRGSGGVTGVIRRRDTRMHLLTVRQIRSVYINRVTQLTVRHWLYGAGEFVAVHRQGHHIVHARIAAHGAGHGGGRLHAFRRIEDVITGDLVNSDIGGGHVVEADTVIRRRGRGIARAVSGGDGGVHLLAVRQVRGVHRDAVAQLTIRHSLYGTGKLMAVHRQGHHIVYPRIPAHGTGHIGG